MPYLDWREAPLSPSAQEITAENTRALPGRVEPQLMTLSLGRQSLDNLLPTLSSVLSDEGGELRVDLPRDWLVFFKLRETESRLLLAHPEADQWVVTIALERSHARVVLEKLRSLVPGASFTIGELGSIGRVSNVDVRIVHAT